MRGNTEKFRSDSFQQYRQLFYYFQYTFALRGNQLIHNPFDPDNLLNVLRQLADDPEYFHYRYEYVAPTPENNSRKTRHTETDPSAPENKLISLSESNRFKKQHGYRLKMGQTVLYTATAENGYRDLMLYQGEYLQRRDGGKWDDFMNLYRAMLIYDLCSNGETADSICTKYGWMYFSDKEFRAVPFDYEFNVDGVTPYLKWLFEQYYGVFDKTLVSAGNYPFISNADENECRLPLIRRIKSHYNRALQLIQLAETRQFKTFPSVISPLQ